MVKVVSVSFRQGENRYYFKASENTLNLKEGERVLVQTKDCTELATIVSGVQEIDEKKLGLELKPVLRKANNADFLKEKENKKKEEIAFEMFKEKVKKRNLKMKEIRAELSFDEKKIIFFYSAAERVDFRELLKDLIIETKSRVELRQINEKDEVLLLGGIGHCGQECCCKRFLKSGININNKMVKDQGLQFNAQKLAGLCGKLMCCLKYEHATYIEQGKDMPNSGKFITIDGEEYRISEANVLTEKIRLRKVINTDEEEGIKMLSNDILILSKEEYLKKLNKSRSESNTKRSKNKQH